MSELENIKYAMNRLYAIWTKDAEYAGDIHQRTMFRDKLAAIDAIIFAVEDLPAQIDWELVGEHFGDQIRTPVRRKTK